MQPFEVRDSQELLTTVVHDLRQPLSTIENCAFMLTLLLPDAPPQVRQYIETIERQVGIATGILFKASGVGLDAGITRDGAECSLAAAAG